MLKTVCLLAGLAACVAPVQAQELRLPGRQLIEDHDVLLEVTYTSLRVRLRLYDLEGRPIDMSRLWLKRCSVDLTATRGERTVQTGTSQLRLIRPEEGLPYLEGRHRLGPLHEQDSLRLAVKLKNLLGRGDRSDRFEVRWDRACRVCGS